MSTKQETNQNIKSQSHLFCKFKWLSKDRLSWISDKWRMVSSSNVHDAIDSSSEWNWIYASIMKFFRNRI